MKHIFLLICAMMSITVFAQDKQAESKLNFEVAVGHTFGLSESFNGKHSGSNDLTNRHELSKDDIDAVMYRAIILYNINTKLSAGLGIDFSTVNSNSKFDRISPLATLRYKPFDGLLHNWYTFINIGPCFRTNNSLYNTSGFMAEVGVGYTKMFAKHFGVFGQVGYSLNQFCNRVGSINAATGAVGGIHNVNSYRNSVFVSAGVVF